MTPAPTVSRCLTSVAVVLLGGALLGDASAQTQRPRLQILNGGHEPVEVFWLKSAQERISNGIIAPGRDRMITTTLGHRFEVATREGRPPAVITCEALVQGYRFDPDARNGVPAFYTQRIDAHGFPIVGSPRVNPFALKEAAYLIDAMLAHRPDVRDAMVRSGARLCILAHNEFTTDLPEFAKLADEPVEGFEGIPAKDYWDARARGTGGSETDPFCSCGEENLLCFPGDPYPTENILIHEFAHNIHLRGMVNVDPTFDQRVKRAYDAAIKAGLWKGKYPSVNHHEYFAEGVQSWFDNNRENDHDHNHVNTRKELLDYDPGLAALCREVFGDTVLKYTKPQTRLSGHLAGYDAGRAPSFSWPARLSAARAAIKASAEQRDERANGHAREARSVAGWIVHISSRLIQQEPEATTLALGLLQKQLEEIARVVPPDAVAELRKVPLYFSPPYPGKRGGAEFHPDAQWLRDNGRDPAMAKGVEFSNIPKFQEEMNRMPNFALHELAHSYHNLVVSDGFKNAEIQALYEHAKASGKYDRVERRHGNGKPNTFERAYAMTNPQEYFAECTEAFFTRNDFFPFTRDQLKQHDAEMFVLLERLWNHPSK